MPPCFKECGLFPQQLLDDHVFSITDATDLTIKVQYMMISILQERSSLEGRPAFKSKAERATPEPVRIDDNATQKSPMTKEELFPNYPWNHDSHMAFGNLSSLVRFHLIGGYIKKVLNGLLVSKHLVHFSGTGIN